MIDLKGIKKFYGEGEQTVKALDGIDLRIERDEYIVVMGPSGSGKSTLLHIIGALDLPTAGAYYLEEVGVHDLSDRELARIRNQHFGFVFQSYNLFPELTALENVLMPHIIGGGRLRAKRGQARELLALVGMEKRINHYPSQLSGGEQQRVAIARALANEPDLILADEPTGNLATKQEDEIMELFNKLHEQGAAIITVTHNSNVAANAKRVVYLEDGRVVFDGPNTHRFKPELLPAPKVSDVGL